jgi:DNA repair protein RAD16
MMEVAVQMSIEASTNGTSGGELTRDELRALQASAAELRRSRLNDDDVIDVDELSALSSMDEDEDEDRSSSKKGKTKVKAVANSSKVMTIKEMKKAQRAEKQEKNAKKRMLKAEEARLRKEYGRNLIQVCIGYKVQSIASSHPSLQAEKNTIALLAEHPELKGVWGDLEANVEPVKPQKAEQPQGLKATLLPFQQESLFWMRKQEQTVWKGGMLAVSLSSRF